MSTKAILTGLLVLFVAQAAGAASWLTSGGRVTTTARPGSYVTYTPAGVSDDSALYLDVNACESFDLLYYNNTNGDATVGTVTVAVQTCAPAAKAASNTVDLDACWTIENTVLTGVAANSLEAIYGASAAWIAVEAGGTENDDDTQQLVLRCHKPRGR